MTYGIVGLGRFGTALALDLAESGSEIIAIDSNEEKVREIREVTENARPAVASATAGFFDGKSIVSLMEFVRFAEIALFFCLNLRDTVIKKMTAAHPAMTNREEGRRCPMKTVPYSPLPRRCGCLTC